MLKLIFAAGFVGYFIVTVHASYDYTIDCESFTAPKGWQPHINSCDAEGNWSSILNRELPEWYNDMKFGIFIHWGIYSVPSWGNEWYWHNLQ